MVQGFFAIWMSFLFVLFKMFLQILFEKGLRETFLTIDEISLPYGVIL